MRRSDCGPLSRAKIERANRGLKPPKVGVVRRKRYLEEARFPSSGQYLQGLLDIAHKRRNVRFKGLWRVHTPLCRQNRTQRFTRANSDVTRGGVPTGLFADPSCSCEGKAGSLLDIDARIVRRCPEATRSRRNAQPCCWFLRCIGELHGLPLLRRNAGESFHAPCCADSFICAL